MAASRSLAPDELLLQLLELASLGATRPEQATRQLRRAHPFARLERRVRDGLRTLEQERLVDSSGDDGGRVVYRTTPSGLEALRRRGRFPGGAAVLFTDIVGSTELIGEFGEDGAHRRRQRHFALLRKAVDEHHGREVKNLGDGLMVIFSDPAAAAECAVAMQRGVAGDDDGLGLRVGLHSGELLREEGDFFGTTVIVARRLCDSADAGQVIVSNEARGQIDGQAFESLGPIALKGIGEPVGASTLHWSREDPASTRPAHSGQAV